jgi:antitoxin ParD1/3/4
MSKPYVLSPAEEAFAEHLVASGRYATVDDAIQVGLRLLREHEDASVLDRDTLRRLWREGIESGASNPAGEMFDRLEVKYEALARDHAS